MSDEKIFDVHSKKTGKLIFNSSVEVNSMEDLSIIYTPGVGKVCVKIHEDPKLVKKYTIAGKTVAVISDGSAVLGLGNIGPKAAMPVMEGKAVIFKEFAGIDALPVCLDTQDTEELIKTIKYLAPNYAAINLEDISAPRCYEIEQRLNEELDIPVMHDDQHGTAIVSLAALKGALQLKPKSNLKVVIVGAGAAGSAILKLLADDRTKKELDIDELMILDSKGVVSKDREDMDKYKMQLAEISDQENTKTLTDAIKGADVFLGVSKPGVLTEEMIKTMNSEPIIFAMANPTPEIMPDKAKNAGASIVATGRSDFPNQVNNALAYPGVFKGLIEKNIRKATIDIKLNAANAIFEYHKDKLSEENILPSVLDKKVVDVIAGSLI